MDIQKTISKYIEELTAIEVILRRLGEENKEVKLIAASNDSILSIVRSDINYLREVIARHSK
jgi:hypothetical protein